jgi:hypothetical protein
LPRLVEVQGRDLLRDPEVDDERDCGDETDDGGGADPASIGNPTANAGTGMALVTFLLAPIRVSL